MRARTRYANPIPGGTILRTDQGVDISATPGTPVFAIATSKVIGTIANWFQGQPLTWFRITSGPGTGRYWYAAEQIDFNVQPGDSVNAGDQIGTYAQSGTATEWGWATSTGQTLAKATTGYHEGDVTPAGLNFKQAVIDNSSSANDRYSLGSGVAAALGTGITRPGGQASGTAADTSSGVDGLFTDWGALVNSPRTAPPNVGGGPLGPFKWWYASFLGKWGKASTPGPSDTGSSAPSSSPSPSNSGSTQGDISYGDVQKIGRGFKWSPAQIGDWWSVISRESGGSATAVNPSSGAFGIGQFLGSTKDEYAKYGATSTNPMQQLYAMAKYISDRYSNPTAALAHENTYNWY